MTINIITVRKAIFLILDARQKDNLVNKHEFTKVSTDYKGDASLSTQCSEWTFNVGTFALSISTLCQWLSASKQLRWCFNDVNEQTNLDHPLAK